MSITPVEQFGMIGRTQDFAIIKHQDDAKSANDQMNIQVTVEKNADQKVNQVQSADNTQLSEKKFDAREKGSNEYTGNGGMNRKKKKDKQEEGKVLLKQVRSFDMRI